MASTEYLKYRLNTLAIMEGKLWDTYCAIEKKHNLLIFNPITSFEYSRELSKKGLLKYYEIYPIHLLAAILSGLTTIFISYWWFIPYGAFVISTLSARKKYLHIYTIDTLKTEKYTNEAFGITNFSLLIIELIELKKAGGSKLNKDLITSIIKIVKDSQEHSEVTFGFSDQFKRYLYATLIPASYSLLKNWEIVVEVFKKNITMNNIFILSICSCILLVFIYDLFFGLPLVKRKKRKYLFLLKILAESYR